MPSASAKKVFVGLSGGVDSSVSAALLKRQGYDVTGVYMKTWQPEWLACTWKDERRDAMRVAAKLGIPFLTFDFEKEYKQRVADYMIEEYRKGRTPNPDIMCNKEIKFGSFLKKSLEMGAEYIATGHYARNISGKLYEAKDKAKDQSYFLWTLSDSELSHVLFPVGNLLKTRVRVLAKKYRLPTAEKKDSQGICFIGEVDMNDFLKHYIDMKPGNVLDEHGNIIGTHDGVWFYTIGERHGFSITKKTDREKPHYVVRKDVEKNELVVAVRSLQTILDYGIKSAVLKDMRLSDESVIGKNIFARIRYRQQKQPCIVKKENHRYAVHFKSLQEGVSVGQSVVFYENEKCLGGGVVDAVLV